MSRMPSVADLSLLSRKEWSSADMPASESVTLSLDPYPGSIDGHVGGVFGLPSGLSMAREFTVELQCTEFSVRSGDGIGSSTSWQDIGTFIGQARDDGGVDVAFCFALPAHVPYSESRPSSAGDYKSWTLRIASKLANEDFERHWRIPVLACGRCASAAVARAQAVVSTADADAQLHLEQGSSGLTMDYPPGRTAATAPLLIVGGAVFCGAGWLITHYDSLFFGLVCWVTGLLAAGPGLWLVGNGLRVELRGGSFFITRRLFGIQVRNVAVKLSRVAGIACSRTGFSEQGAEVKVYYRLVVKTSDGASYIVGDSFVGYGEAMAGARRLAQLTGLKLLEHS